MEAVEELAVTGGADGGAAGRGALVFAGFMGAGKSTAARVAAGRIGARALDSDRELERELGEPIEAFFEREGEAAFRAREEAVVLRLLSAADARVVALGGGALESERVRGALARHLVVLLDVDPGDAWRRAAGRGRPLARDRASFEELWARRRALYEAAADAFLPAGDRNLVARALPALQALAAAGADSRLVWASAASGDYPVFLGNGLVASGFFFPTGARRFSVTDANVAARHRVAGDFEVVVPPGESQKTMGRAEDVLRQLVRAGMRRDDLVVAVGGGVVGDLAGFCAAVYQRGVRHVQVPTTLVAQVDSAYGGKTGVDLPEGKNYAGAYHQPSAVITDPAALGTLPAEERSAGYAEVLKTALIAGGALWERVRSGAVADDDVILGCVRTKLAVVAADERDAGGRQVLNLGHTVAHALETATGYRRYRHGEAVSIGLLCALRLSGQDELREEVAGLLSAQGLPERAEGVGVEEAIRLTARDKKGRGGRVPFVLVEGPGKVTHGHELPQRDLRAALAEVCAP